MVKRYKNIDQRVWGYGRLNFKTYSSGYRNKGRNISQRITRVSNIAEHCTKD